jgi:ADP-ribose pyrophosphatase YjhB (NUDIX family)
VSETRWFFRDPDAPEPNRPRALSVYALIERDDALLLERRADAPVWSLIAGFVEDDESLSDALRREVREETSLIVVRYDLFGTFTDPSRIVSYPDGNVYSVATFAYTVEVEDFAPLSRSDESEELRFFSRNELLNVEVPVTQRIAIEMYLAERGLPYLE